MAIPSLAMIPSGYKDGKVYSVLPTNGDGDFDFSRGSNATRVNKDGLIETVTGDTPRLDYTDSSCPSLLLEPQRTNAATYSEAFDNSFWTKDNATVVGGYSAPDGSNNAFKLIEGTSNSQHNVGSSFITTTNGSEIAASVFVKADTRSEVSMQEAAYTGVYLSVDLISETITTNGTSANLTKLVNGWFRIDIISTCNIVTAWKIMPSLNGTSTYQGDGTSGIYIWGFQLEDVASYATSYIPTSGSAATRLADVCDGAGNADTFNGSEGVLYAEIIALADSGNGQIRINEQGVLNSVIMEFRNSGTILRTYIFDGNATNQFFSETNINPNDNIKIALKYKQNDCSLYLNGLVKVTDINATMPSNLNSLSFNQGDGSSNFKGSVKDLRVYNTTLTDEELAELTKV